MVPSFCTALGFGSNARMPRSIFCSLAFHSHTCSTWSGTVITLIVGSSGRESRRDNLVKRENAEQLEVGNGAVQVEAVGLTCQLVDGIFSSPTVGAQVAGESRNLRCW